jgi:hypothetical protein
VLKKPSKQHILRGLSIIRHFEEMHKCALSFIGTKTHKKVGFERTSPTIDAFSALVWRTNPTRPAFGDFRTVFGFGTQTQKRPCMERTSPTAEAILVKTWSVQTTLLHPYVDVYFRVLIKLGFT